MKYILVILVLILVGCSDKVTTKDIEEAQDKCSTNEGLEYFYRWTPGYGHVYCNNGAKFQLGRD